MSRGASGSGAILVYSKKGQTYSPPNPMATISGDIAPDMEPHTVTINVSLPDALSSGNGTIFAHVLAIRSDDRMSGQETFSGAWGVHPIVVYLPKRKEEKLRALIGGSDDDLHDGSTDDQDRVQPRFGIGLSNEDESSGGSQNQDEDQDADS